MAAGRGAAGSSVVLQKGPSEGSCVITEKAPTRAFSWLKAATTAFSMVSYSRPSLMIIASRTQFHVERPWGQRPFSMVS